MTASDDVRSNARRAYTVLRQRIIQCAIAPLQKLKIAELADELRVSPGAIREALSRLTTEALVVAEDQRGFRAAPISAADLDDLTDARIEIESLLLRRSIARGGEDWHGTVRTAAAAIIGFVDDIASAEAAGRHAQFHETLVAASGNRALLRVRESLYEMSQRYRYLAALSGNIGRQVDDEHAAIAAAVLANNADAAAEAMARHIRETAVEVRNVLSAIDR